MKTAPLDFILLIPCYNDLKGLTRSVESINYPSHKFEILIVDDGSISPISVNILKSLFSDLKIEVLRLNDNKGILSALNAGLEHIKNRNDYKYIARLDARDTCHSDRFVREVTFLNENPEIGLVGTWCRFTELASGKSYFYKTKTKHDEIMKEMHYKCSFIHPTVMFRSEVLDIVGIYPKGYPHAEDYAYFWKILKKFKGAILPEILVNIEYSGNNVSSKNYRAQLKSRMKVVKFFGENDMIILLSSCLLFCKSIFPKKMIEKLKLIN